MIMQNLAPILMMEIWLHYKQPYLPISWIWLNFFSRTVNSHWASVSRYHLTKIFVATAGFNFCVSPDAVGSQITYGDLISSSI